jgi:phosphatidylglycerophosphatase A
LREWVVKLLATFFYLGYSPVAPGTAGTIGAILPFYLISNLSPLAYFLILLGFIIFSIWISTEASAIFNKTDPSSVVLDEVCGYLVTMFLVPASLLNILLGFFLFRFFDVLKPPPIKSAENLPRGLGIVADDVLAGIYANIVLQVVVRFIFPTN